MRRRGRRLRGLVITVAAVVAMVALLATTIEVPFAGVTRRRPEPPTTVPLTAAGRELRRMLDRAAGSTFHARYGATSEELAGADIAVETWRQDGRARQDTEIAYQGSVSRTRALLLGSTALSCSQSGELPWTCRRLLDPAGADADPILGGVRSQLPRSTVEARDDTHRGGPVRCFTLANADRTTEFCVTPEAVPARLSSTGISSRGISLELAELGHDVSDDVFEPPAPVEP